MKSYCFCRDNTEGRLSILKSESSSSSTIVMRVFVGEGLSQSHKKTMSKDAENVTARGRADQRIQLINHPQQWVTNYTRQADL